MKEFMLLIRNEDNGHAEVSPEQFQKFINLVMVYIEDLKKKGTLKSAQPLERGGKMISHPSGAFKDGPYNETKETIVGYYHIIAKDLDEAVAIAKANPEMEFIPGSKIEIRPIKGIEESIDYEYPKGE